MALQLLEPERRHALLDLRPRRRQAPHDLLHHVGLHVAVQHLLLLLLGDDLSVVVAHVAREEDLARRQEHLRRLGIGEPEPDAVAETVLVHFSRRGEGQDRFLAKLGGEGEYRLRLVGAVHQARRARGGDVAPQLDRERRAARNIERLERQRRGAAQAEAAAREERGNHDPDDGAAHQTTTFTRRPGTTTTFLTGWPSAKRATASCASASCSICSRAADRGARTCPRSLPFTWRTSSISSVSSACASTAGHAAAPTSPA